MHHFVAAVKILGYVRKRRKLSVIHQHRNGNVPVLPDIPHFRPVFENTAFWGYAVSLKAGRSFFSQLTESVKELIGSDRPDPRQISSHVVVLHISLQATQSAEDGRVVRHDHPRDPK